MNLLLISNSTNAGEEYLAYPKQQIADFLHKKNVHKVLFIPYAAVTFSFDEYVEKVQDRFAEFNVLVAGIHTFQDPVAAVEEAEAIVIGGGNTFYLLRSLYDNELINIISKRVRDDMPYIGWSAGSNVACPTICTTNDMPIVQPQSLKALNFIPFQINPHYLDVHPEGHAGETREQRILEYIEANHHMYVAGLREGCMFLLENNRLQFIGDHSVRLFKYGEETRELFPGDDLAFLLK